MIRLEINGHKVDVDENLSFDFYDYNNIFDVERNRGAFSYDIDIDLKSGNNAKLYQHMQRINSTSFFTGRSASIFVGGVVLVKGKEVILECNGYKAKIQIVGGSSEVNAEGSSIRMSDLDLGQLPEYTEETALATINADPLTVPAVCTPVMVNYRKMPFVSQNVERDTVFDMVNLANYVDVWSASGSWYRSENYSPLFRGQPYLVLIIERVLQALGWTVTDNILRTMDYAKRLIVVHGYDTRNISEILPNWKVNEFLEQIQRMFNVIFVNDEKNRTVSIQNRNTYYQNVAETVIFDLDDIVFENNSPAIKFDSSEEYVYNYEAIKYDLPSKVYGQRADISDDVNEVVSLVYSNYFSDFNSASSPYRSANFYNQAFFFYNVPTDTKWMITKGSPGQASINYIFVRVDQFAHARKSTYKEGDTETVLKIVPAETLVMSILLTDPTLNVGAVIPYAQVSGVVGADYTTTSDYGLNQWVEGNAPKKKDTKSEKLYVAQYLGRTTMLSDTHGGTSEASIRKDTARYPQVYTHRYIDGRIYGTNNNIWNGNWKDLIMDALWDKDNLEEGITFNLKRRLNTTYSNSLQVNYKDEHTIYIKVKGRINVASIFNIAGRMFICVSLQYLVRNGKLLPYAIGKFLPII